MLSRTVCFDQTCEIGLSVCLRGEFLSAPQKQGLQTEMSRVH